MTEPTFDRDGDITEETRNRIATWPPDDGWMMLLEFLDSCWSHEYGRIFKEGRRWKFVTGGWSANEGIVSAMDANVMFNAACWQKSERGGLHVYEVPENLR